MTERPSDQQHADKPGESRLCHEGENHGDKYRYRLNGAFVCVACLAQTAWQGRGTQSAAVASVTPYQERVRAFMVECFGPEFFTQGLERDHRFLEESLELVQANGCSAADAHMLVDYVYGRPAGKPHQECGGVMTTLAAVCLSRGLDMAQAGEDELARVWTKIDVIREKQKTKPKGSPLPQYAERVARSATERTEIPAELYDGMAVYVALGVEKTRDIRPEMVSDVLDTVVRLIRKGRALNNPSDRNANKEKS